MFDTTALSETFWNSIVERLAQSLCKLLLPRLEALLTVQPRWLSIESAGAYIDKTYEGMRHTLQAHQKELPIVMIGGKPRIDIKDIDRLCMNLKR
jgi:hypothetical protein